MREIDKEVLFNKYNLDTRLKKLIEEQEITTGKEFKFIEKPDISVRATIKIAREGMSKHILYLRTLRTPFLNHIIAHELGHLIRMAKVVESERLVPSVTSANFLNFRADLENSVAGEKLPFKEEMFQDLLRIWHNGLISQLTNLPVDYRVEAWIYESFPNMRPEQRASVESDLLAAAKGASKEVKALTPSLIYSISLAMSCAFAKGMDLLLGTEYMEYYSDALVREKGEALYEFLSSRDSGYVQDINTINSWANLLGMKDWFTWIPFNDVPENYENETL